MPEVIRDLSSFLTGLTTKTASAQEPATPTQNQEAAKSAAEIKKAEEAAAAAKAAAAKKAEAEKAAEAAKQAEAEKAAANAGPQIEAGQVLYDPALLKTAEQQALAQHGYGIIPDAEKAAEVYGLLTEKQASLKKQAEAAKQAEAEAAGRMAYIGQAKTAAALALAQGECSVNDVLKQANALGYNVNDVIAEARRMKIAMGDVESAATPNDVFFQGQQGSAARSSTSNWQQAAEQTRETVPFTPQDASGVTQPVRGQDQKSLGFNESVVMPNNPGLDHGQKTTDGK